MDIMKILAIVGALFLIFIFMIPSILSISYGFDVMWILCAVFVFILGVVFFIISVIKLKQEIEYDLNKKQRLDS